MWLLVGGDVIWLLVGRCDGQLCVLLLLPHDELQNRLEFLTMTQSRFSDGNIQTPVVSII